MPTDRESQERASLLASTSELLQEAAEKIQELPRLRLLALKHTGQEKERLDEFFASATNLLARQEDLNSSYPETKAFLAARGLANVRELDDKGREELLRHLYNVLFKENPAFVS